jgi:hypothetical protein
VSTWKDIIFDALVEIDVYNPNDPLLAEDAQQGARRLNRIIDSWAARKIFAFSQTFNLYTLTPNHQPTLIGPGLTSPDFATNPASAPRPTSIESISLVLNDQTPVVDLPLNRRDKAWWANQQVKPLTTNVPTDYYYQPNFPNGAIYFWPVPNYAYQARVEERTELAQVPSDLTQSFVAPQGYELASMLTLAEHSATPYGRPMPPDLPGRAARARATVQGNNAASPRIASADWGTRGKRATADFNYFTGGPSSRF